MTAPRARTLALAIAALAAPAAVRAQQPAPDGRCILEAMPQPGRNVTTTASQLPSGNYNVFQGGGPRYICQGQDITLDADSTEYYGDRNVLYLIGNVRYREPRVRINADRMTYYRLEDRLVAEGNVLAEDDDGSRMRGPNAEYLRARPGRPQRLVATGRPTLDLVEVDSTGKAAEPVNVVADRITTEADSLVYAGGDVRITRPDVRSRSDSAFLDSGREFARLMRQPSIEGRGERPFTLTAQLIDLFSRERELRRVLATTDAHVVSEDMDLRADSLDLRFAQGALEEAFAWGPSRARAVSPGSTILADSLHVVMADQRLRQVFAAGNAFAETTPDTLRIRTTERDWLRGDTIVALFDTATAPAGADSAARSRPPIRELVAIGEARSFYHLANAESPREPAVNYVVGDTITVDFREREVDTVTVTGDARGVYVERERPVDRDRRAGTSAGSPRAGGPP